jgi:hypothetical protein
MVESVRRLTEALSVVVLAAAALCGSGCTLTSGMRSMNKNAEESLAFYDRGFARMVESMFEEDRKQCEEITFKAWKSRGPAKRLAELVLWIWEPYY